MAATVDTKSVTPVGQNLDNRPKLCQKSHSSWHLLCFKHIRKHRNCCLDALNSDLATKFSGVGVIYDDMDSPCTIVTVSPVQTTVGEASEINSNTQTDLSLC